jgi:hypothetical protein
MVQNNNCIEKAEIIKLNFDEIERTFTEIYVRVNGKEVECFNPSSDTDYIIGNIYNVIFSLITFNVKKINNGKKIEVKSKLGSVCHCTLYGELINMEIKYQEAKGHRIYYKYGYIDCGICVKVEMPLDFEANVGEYLYAEGRLDIKKA